MCLSCLLVPVRPRGSEDPAWAAFSAHLDSHFRGNERRLVQRRCKPKFIALLKHVPFTSIVNPLTPPLSPAGRGSRPCSRHTRGSIRPKLALAVRNDDSSS